MNKKVTYSVAMSRDTGCIVMVRTRGKAVEVMGSMTREQSLTFADGVIDWGTGNSQDTKTEPLEPEKPRPVYPH